MFADLQLQTIEAALEAGFKGLQKHFAELGSEWKQAVTMDCQVSGKNGQKWHTDCRGTQSRHDVHQALLIEASALYEAMICSFQRFTIFKEGF